MVQTLSRLVADDAPLVAKRALRASGRIIRSALKWIASVPLVTTEMETSWMRLSSLKVQIINMIDSDNDGYNSFQSAANRRDIGRNVDEIICYLQNTNAGCEISGRSRPASNLSGRGYTQETRRFFSGGRTADSENC